MSKHCWLCGTDLERLRQENRTLRALLLEAHGWTVYAQSDPEVARLVNRGKLTDLNTRIDQHLHPDDYE